MENITKNIIRPQKKFKTTSIKGKDYVEVKERINYLAYDFQGDYSIETSYKYYPEAKLWVVKAWLTMVKNGFKSVYTGHGQEIESANYKDVNHTSALENAETSAVGRACAMAGIGIDISIASVDEINKATNRQAQQPVTPKASETQYKEETSPKPDNGIQDNPTIANHTTEPSLPKASARQQEEIIRLLNNPVITRQEKTKMLLNVNKLDEERAAGSIAKLKKTIEEREEQSATAK